MATAAQAASTTYRLMLQSRTDTAAPNEVYVASYADYASLQAGTLGAGSGYTQIGISSAFQIAGLTHDGSAYRMMLQSRTDTAAPNEVYIASYANFADLQAGNLGAGSGYTQIGISSAFRIAGLAYDGSAYRMMLQSRADTAAPNEIYIASYSSFADLQNATLGAGSGYTQIGISSAFNVRGFTWDGSAYRVMLQSLADTAAPNEVYIASYSSFADLQNATLGAGSGYTQIGISSAFIIAGLATEIILDPPPPPPPPGVPEPQSWALLILGFGAVGTRLRRRRLQAA
ncbi:PEPxxWA-CTERM sorting domain-containing protein [Sandarakinorhabdus oryzae]|uniref:PEPxxWA-CTERM sorting domain-containing protein n=1 Tax=Sandarakinorhabdus oryzae TaxID=2675220 RepID=UPI001F1A9D26|nr:PEPxxWA-CTERM sorting domain-containing protein [Sandarakinorhabdus oryzae]